MLRYVCPKSVHPFVRPSICLLSISFYDSAPLARLLDGDMRVLPLQMHSIGSSTVSYACVQMHASISTPC